MTDSGLAAIIVSALVGISTAKTLPIWSYISASVVNLFIPSQGGQFIVQGPLLMDAAQQLGADKMTVINAFVYGDEATNLLQPLYILPGLAMVGVEIKGCMGYYGLRMVLLDHIHHSRFCNCAGFAPIISSKMRCNTLCEFHS